MYLRIRKSDFYASSIILKFSVPSFRLYAKLKNDLVSQVVPFLRYCHIYDCVCVCVCVCVCACVRMCVQWRIQAGAQGAKALPLAKWLFY